MSTRKTHRAVKGIAEIERKTAVESFISRRTASRHLTLSLPASPPIVFNRRADIDQRAVNLAAAPVDRLWRPLPTLGDGNAQWQSLLLLESLLSYELKTSKKAGLEGTPLKSDAPIDINPSDGN